MLTADYLFWPVLAGVVLFNIRFAARIRAERVAMQWDFHGKPTWHAPKRLAVWGIVPLMLMVRLIIWAGMTYAPERVHWPEAGLALAAIIGAAAHVYVMVRAAKVSAVP